MSEKKYELVHRNTQKFWCPDRQLHVELTQIRALTHFVTASGSCRAATLNVKPGDLGGYVETEDNLSQIGLCWIDDGGAAYHNARIAGSGRVSSNAIVRGNAKVYDSAMIRDSAFVEDNAEVFGTAIVSNFTAIRDNAKISHLAAFYSGYMVTGDSVITNGSFRLRGELRNAKIRNYSDYMVFQNVGSEWGTLTAYRNMEDGITINRGCFVGSIGAFTKASEFKHTKEQFDEYQLLIQFIKTRFANLQEYQKVKPVR